MSAFRRTVRLKPDTTYSGLRTLDALELEFLDFRFHINQRSRLVIEQQGLAKHIDAIVQEFLLRFAPEPGNLFAPRNQVIDRGGISLGAESTAYPIDEPIVKLIIKMKASRTRHRVAVSISGTSITDDLNRSTSPSRRIGVTSDSMKRSTVVGLA